MIHNHNSKLIFLRVVRETLCRLQIADAFISRGWSFSHSPNLTRDPRQRALTPSADQSDTWRQRAKSRDVPLTLGTLRLSQELALIILQSFCLTSPSVKSVILFIKAFHRSWILMREQPLICFFFRGCIASVSRPSIYCHVPANIKTFYAAVWLFSQHVCCQSFNVHSDKYKKKRNNRNCTPSVYTIHPAVYRWLSSFGPCLLFLLWVW